MVGICSYGAYVPLYRLTREEMGKLEGKMAGPGERSVAGFDEDGLTMAVAAAKDCMSGVDVQATDGLLFASTTSPFAEKQMASMVASVIGVGNGAFTMDCANSLRAGTSAMKLAVDAIKNGSKRVLVTAADCRLGKPLSMLEQNLGDGAGALLLGDSDVAVSIEGFHSVSSEFIDLWRPAGDRFVHSWQDRFAVVGGYQPIGKKAIAEAMKKFGLEAKDFAKVIISGPDARSISGLATSLGFDAKAQLQNPLFNMMGNTGTAFPLMLLVAALEEAKPGDKILLASYGDGVDVFLLQVNEGIEKLRSLRGIGSYLKSKRALPSYAKYLRLRHLFPAEGSRFTDIIVSLSQVWRERASLMKLHASKCNQCGFVEFPIRRICAKCHSKDDYAEVNLTDQKVTLYSFSTDSNPMMPECTDPPVGRAVVDFDGGARMEVEMVDYGAIEDLKVGMPMEMTFRRYERQGDVPAYSWKCTPVR